LIIANRVPLSIRGDLYLIRFSQKVVAMNRLVRLWDWLLPGLISLSPIGAIAYYNAGAAEEAAQPGVERAASRSFVSNARMGPAVIPLARL
jgi:hypothetical protein